MPVGRLLAVGGGLLTLAPSRAVFVAGLALLTAGFFGVDGDASGSVPLRAHGGGVDGPGAPLHLFTFCFGSSVSAS